MNLSRFGTRAGACCCCCICVLSLSLWRGLEPNKAEPAFTIHQPVCGLKQIRFGSRFPPANKQTNSPTPHKRQPCIQLPCHGRGVSESVPARTMLPKVPTCSRKARTEEGPRPFFHSSYPNLLIWCGSALTATTDILFPSTLVALKPQYATDRTKHSRYDFRKDKSTWLFQHGRPLRNTRPSFLSTPRQQQQLSFPLVVGHRGYLGKTEQRLSSCLLVDCRLGQHLWLLRPPVFQPRGVKPNSYYLR